MVGAIAPTYLFDFCCAKMAESIGIDSARLVLAHALFILFGKALLKFFSVLDSVSCLDSESALDFVNYLESERLDFKFCFCES